MGAMSRWNTEALCQRIQLLYPVCAAGPNPGVVVSPEKQHWDLMGLELSKQLIDRGAVSCDDPVEDFCCRFVLGWSCYRFHKLIIYVDIIGVYLRDDMIRVTSWQSGEKCPVAFLQ